MQIANVRVVPGDDLVKSVAIPVCGLIDALHAVIILGIAG